MNLRAVADRLAAAGVADPVRDARVLFDWAYGIGGKTGEPQDRDAPNATTLEHFDRAIKQRVKRQPVSQIIGTRSFWRHDFVVSGDVLDPRPDTETLVEQALSGPFTRVLDLGTGTGCIVISLLAERPEAKGMAVDVSEQALAVARINARKIGVEDRLDLRVSDWFGAVGGQFDLIVSNPPYIAADEMPGLAPEVREWEPRMALTDEADGLEAYRIIAKGAADWLCPGGRLLVEIGPSQGAAVNMLFAKAGFVDNLIVQDLDGRDRVVSGTLPQ